MKMPNLNNRSGKININPVYKSLYEIHYFTNRGSFEYECYNFEIDGDYCINKLQDAKNTKLELFRDINYLVVILHDKRGYINKWMKIEVDLDKINYQLSWESSDLSQIDITFKIKQIETHTVDDYQMLPCDLINSLKRDIRINEILE